jgi:hypothetical protein
MVIHKNLITCLDYDRTSTHFTNKNISCAKERSDFFTAARYKDFHFSSGQTAVSYVFHQPEITNGTEVTIVSPHFGHLYVIQLPNGELHRWFTHSELKTIYSHTRCLRAGDCAAILSTNGHHTNIQPGTLVRIAKVLSNTYYYDVKLADGSYHRWLADSELAEPMMYHCHLY